MNVTGIFKTLIIIVACVAVGAIILNVLLPNVVVSVVDTAEDMIYSATKISFDFNGNGNDGKADGNAANKNANAMEGTTGIGVSGFDSGAQDQTGQ